jgi:hypothetical protein
MALKLVRFIGSITLGDDNASGIEIGKLGGGSVFRISEFGGQDIFFKITLNSDRTAVTATNGMYLKASTSITVVPEEIIRNGEGKALLDGTDSSSSDAGSFISMEDATDESSNVGNALQYNFGQTSYFISIINETAGSNGKVYVQEVAQHDSI